MNESAAILTTIVDASDERRAENAQFQEETFESDDDADSDETLTLPFKKLFIYLVRWRLLCP